MTRNEQKFTKEFKNTSSEEWERMNKQFIVDVNKNLFKQQINVLIESALERNESCVILLEILEQHCKKLTFAMLKSLFITKNIQINELSFIVTQLKEEFNDALDNIVKKVKEIKEDKI